MSLPHHFKFDLLLSIKRDSNYPFTNQIKASAYINNNIKCCDNTEGGGRIMSR